MMASRFTPHAAMEGCKFPGLLYAVLITQALALHLTPLHAADYPSVAAEVSFDAVQALPSAEPQDILRYGPADPQFVELWLPAGTAPAPVVAFIHGGCWLNAYGIDHAQALATALVDEGYAVWNIEYRRLGDEGGGWPGSLEDIRLALAELETLQHPRLDLDRLVLAGHSAGGHLALLAAGNPPAGLAPQGVIGLAPITDIAHYAKGEGGCNQAAARFVGDSSDDRMNPALQPVPRGTVLLLGSKDRIVPYEPPYLAAQTVAGIPAGHFDWIHPGTPAWSRFMEELARLQP